MTDLADLDEQLRALSRSINVDPPTDDLAEQVLARVLAERPGRFRRAWHWLVRSRRRLVAMIIAAVVIALGLTPPVRATVLEWLRIDDRRRGGPTPGRLPAEHSARARYARFCPRIRGPTGRLDGLGFRRHAGSPRPVRWGAVVGVRQEVLGRRDAHHGGWPGSRLACRGAPHRLCRSRGHRAHRVGPDRRPLPGLAAHG